MGTLRHVVIVAFVCLFVTRVGCIASWSWWTICGAWLRKKLLPEQKKIRTGTSLKCVKVLATVVTEETYYLDLYALATLATRLPTQPLLHCPVVKKELPPQGGTLWTLPHSSWPSNQPLPNFCTFGFYMFNPQTGSRLLQASQSLTPPAGKDHFSCLMMSAVSGMGKMGEVYMTGLLAQEAGLSHSDLAHLWTLNPLR